MARVTKEGGLSGAIQNLVFYTMDGKNYVRSKPIMLNKKKNRHQNRSVVVFGVVSACSSALLRNMAWDLLFRIGFKTHNAFRSWMTPLYQRYMYHNPDGQWELSARHAAMFEINPAASLHEAFRVPIDVADAGEGRVKITIGELKPVQHIQAPRWTKSVNLTLQVLTTPFTENYGRQVVHYSEMHAYPYIQGQEPAKEFIVQTKNAKGHVAVVVAALTYNTRTTEEPAYHTDLQYLPAAVVAIGRLR